jgi:hypothetical protein
MTTEDRTLALAAELAAALAEHGAKCAVIGAVALAVRGYPRATEDIDLATVTDPNVVLLAVAEEMRGRGYEAELAMPDADDPLGGVLTVRSPDSDPVQVVNYFNPWNGWVPAGKQAVETAETDLLPSLAVVDVPHLVALKLYAGGRKSELDILELLERQPTDVLDAVRKVCVSLDLEAELRTVVPHAFDGT